MTNDDNLSKDTPSAVSDVRAADGEAVPSGKAVAAGNSAAGSGDGSADSAAEDQSAVKDASAVSKSAADKAEAADAACKDAEPSGKAEDGNSAADGAGSGSADDADDEDDGKIDWFSVFLIILIMGNVGYWLMVRDQPQGADMRVFLAAPAENHFADSGRRPEPLNGSIEPPPGGFQPQPGEQPPQPGEQPQQGAPQTAADGTVLPDAPRQVTHDGKALEIATAEKSGASFETRRDFMVSQYMYAAEVLYHLHADSRKIFDSDANAQKFSVSGDTEAEWRAVKHTAEISRDLLRSAYAREISKAEASTKLKGSGLQSARADAAKAEKLLDVRFEDAVAQYEAVLVRLRSGK